MLAVTRTTTTTYKFLDRDACGKNCLKVVLKEERITNFPPLRSQVLSPPGELSWPSRPPPKPTGRAEVWSRIFLQRASQINWSLELLMLLLLLLLFLFFYVVVFVCCDCFFFFFNVAVAAVVLLLLLLFFFLWCCWWCCCYCCCCYVLQN